MSNERYHALNHEQIVDAIVSVGASVSIMVRGNMGVGKTSLMKMLEERLPTHKGYTADTSMMDIPDVAMYDINNSTNSLNFIYNEALGLHEDRPIILNLDEFGKAPPSVKLMLLRLVLERKMGNRTLHPDSIVLLTSNLEGEGVGDLLPAHACNRITVVELAKPTVEKWIEWGIDNKLHSSLLGWVKDNESVMADWRDIKNPDDNHHIFHPQAVGRTQFCTPRSLAKASSILHGMGTFDEHTLRSLLVGTIGSYSALELVAFHKLASELPSAESIMNSPETAVIPSRASGKCMVIFRTLTNMDKDMVTPFCKYVRRMEDEIISLFINGCYRENYHARSVVMTNKAFSQLMIDYNFVHVSDKV
jgi:hypothetical protein